MTDGASYHLDAPPDPNAALISSPPRPSRTLTEFGAILPAGQDQSRSLRGRSVEPDPTTMLDIVFLAGGLAFFAAASGYGAICERL